MFSGSILDSIWVVSVVVELKLVSLEVSPDFSYEVVIFRRYFIFADEIVAADAHALLLC